MKRDVKLMQKARRSGLTAADLCRIKEMARKQAGQMELEATARAFVFMLAIPLNVLVSDYWQKAPKWKLKRFINDVISLYDSVQEGVVTDRELAKLLKDTVDLEVNEEWIKQREARNEV